MNETEVARLLREIRDVVTEHAVQLGVHTQSLEVVGDEQVKTNGRLTDVERSQLMQRGGLIMLSFLITVGTGIAAIAYRGGI